jgi:hypothetical protein
MKKNKVLCNAFSLQMVSAENMSRVRFEPIDQPCDSELKFMDSAVGHADTAEVLGVVCNRMNVVLDDDTDLFVAQLTGGRLPEGSTELPEGFEFKWVRVRLALATGRLHCNNGMVNVVG